MFFQNTDAVNRIPDWQPFMKVLLISPNIEALPDPVFPIGLAYIAAALDKNAIPYQVLDLCFEQDPDSSIELAINYFNPDIIALSLRNCDNVSYPNYISYIPFYQHVVQTIRKSSSAFIVLGGSGFALLPEPILKFLGADFGIAGEGESAFIELINIIEKNRGVSDGLKKGVVCNYDKVIHNLDSSPIPDRSMFDNKAYLNQGGMGNIQTKRGCPFNCIYCTYPVIEGRKVRLRNPESVCDEIESLLEYGIDNLFFVDNTFNFPIDHARDICREIINRRLPVKWSCYANPKFITTELVETMLDAGCTGLEFGSDAANDTMLAGLGKNFNVADLRNSSLICKESGISFCHSLLLGGPGETMETVKQTLNEILDMSPTAAICMAGIRIFPKTRLSVIAEQEGIIEPGEDFLNPVFYISDTIKGEIVPFLEGFSKDHQTWIFPGMNINMNSSLQKKLRRFGIKGPLWEYMKTGEKFRKQ